MPLYAWRNCGQVYPAPLCGVLVPHVGSPKTRAARRIARRQSQSDCTLRMQRIERMLPAGLCLARHRSQHTSHDKWVAAEENALLLRNSDRHQAATLQQPGTELESDHRADSSVVQDGLDSMEDSWTKCGRIADRLHGLQTAGFPSASARCHIEYMLRTCYTNERARAVALHLREILNLSEIWAWWHDYRGPNLLLFPPHSLPSRYERLSVLAATPSQSLKSISSYPNVLTLSSKSISGGIRSFSDLGYAKDEQFTLLCATVRIKYPEDDTLKEAHAKFAHIFEGSHAEVRALVKRIPYILESVTLDAEGVAARVKMWAEAKSVPIHSGLKELGDLDLLT